MNIISNVGVVFISMNCIIKTKTVSLSTERAQLRMHVPKIFAKMLVFSANVHTVKMCVLYDQHGSLIKQVRQKLGVYSFSFELMI